MPSTARVVLVDLDQLVDGNGGLGGLGHGYTVCEAAHVARAVARGKGRWIALHMRPLAGD